MQAIITKYVGPTNHRGARVTAKSGYGFSHSVEYNQEFASSANHYCAAWGLADKMGWKGRLIGGSLDNGKMAWVFDTRDDV